MWGTQAVPSQNRNTALVLALDRGGLRSGQGLGGLARFRWSGGRRRRRGCGYGYRSLADLDGALVAVDDQVRTVRSDRTISGALPVLIVDFQLAEVALDVALAGARFHFDGNVRWNRNLNVPFSIIDLNIARIVQAYRHRAIIVFQTQVTGQSLEPDVLGARGQAHGTVQRVGAQVAAI